MRLIPALLLSLGLATTAIADDTHDDHDHDEQDTHLAVMDGVEVLHPWTNAGTGPMALIFAEVENTGDTALTLLGAESDDATSAELVGFMLKDGSENYQVIPMLEIAPGRELDLAPRGVAIRLNGLTTPRTEGDEIEIHLLTDRGELALHVAVEAEDAMKHSHAGHAH